MSVVAWTLYTVKTPYVFLSLLTLWKPLSSFGLRNPSITSKPGSKACFFLTAYHPSLNSLLMKPTLLCYCHSFDSYNLSYSVLVVAPTPPPLWIPWGHRSWCCLSTSYLTKQKEELWLITLPWKGKICLRQWRPSLLLCFTINSRYSQRKRNVVRDCIIFITKVGPAYEDFATKSPNLPRNYKSIWVCMSHCFPLTDPEHFSPNSIQIWRATIQARQVMHV